MGTNLIKYLSTLPTQVYVYNPLHISIYHIHDIKTFGVEIFENYTTKKLIYKMEDMDECREWLLSMNKSSTILVVLRQHAQ